MSATNLIDLEKSGSGTNRSHPWIVGGLLILGGWLLESLFVSLQLHRQAAAGLSVHLSHLWLGPLLLLGLWFLIRRRVPEGVSWTDGLLKRPALMRNLRPEIKALATQVLSSPIESVLLAFLWRYPNMMLTADNLAYRIGEEEADAGRSLNHLQSLGLIEQEHVGDLHFYRLTRNPQRRAQLEALVAWQVGWFERSQQLSRAVGPSLLWRDW